MKLTGVTPYVVRTPSPHWGGFTWYFVRLDTDNGLVGWGETAVLSAYGNLEASYCSLVEQAFAAFLEGKSPLDREGLYQTLVESMTHQHPDYATMGIISAFDTALWDICGKYYDTPVYNLLGGLFRERIRSYTYIYDGGQGGEVPGLLDTLKVWTKDAGRMRELAAAYADDGFTGLKFDPLPQSPRGQLPVPPWEPSMEEYHLAEQIVAAAREGVGNRADLLIGTHGQITPSAAKRLAARIEQYDPLWLEEPCPPENYAQMGEIARATNIPIATGERLVGVHEFQNLFREGACAFAQPDLGSCGGITGCKKIATLAEANYVLMAPHVWGGPVITAAAMQIDASIPNFLIQECINKADGFLNEIIKEPFVWEDGDLIVQRDRPGIGIELVPEKLLAYAP